MRVVLRRSWRAAAVAAAAALVSVGLGSIPATAIPVACTPTSSSPTATDELRQFTNTTACEWTVPAGVTSIELLVVAGGGGGGATSKQSSPLMEHNGGGGGGGEVLAVSSQTVVPGETITITVGAGGTGGNNGVTVTNGDGLDGSDGGDTTLVFSTTTSGDVTAQGGGGGGGGGWYNGTPTYENGRPGRPGGSGGGGGTGSVNGGAGGTSTASGSGLGYAGSIGRHSTSAIAGAGHGGGAGGAATTNAVGPAYASNITRPAADTKVARGGYGVSDSIGKWYQQNQVYPGSGGETASNTNIEAGFNGSGNGQNGVVYIRYSTATAPGAPTSVTASASSTPAAVDLTWQAPSSDGGAAITDYVIEYSTDGSTGWTEFVHTASTSTSITVTGLVAQSTYYFRVAAKNSAGTGPTEAATPAPVTSSAAVAPGAPTSVTATAGAAHGTLDIAWTAPTSDGGSPITDYVVEYSADGSTGWTAFSHTASTTPSLTITGLTPGGTYYVRVSATNSVGTGATAAATPAPASAAPAVAPDAPTAVTLAAGTPGGSIDVSWTAPADDGGSAITDYLVEYSLTGSGGWTTFSRAPSTATATTILGLTASTNYYVRVSAINAIGAGQSASGTPSPTSSSAATVPTAPRAVTAIGGVAGGSLDIAWTLPESDGASAITDYLIEYQESPSGSWTAFTHPPSAATSATITGLTPGSAYNVRVSAVNGVGTGPSAAASPSPATAAATVPDPPTSVTASDTGAAGTLDISWLAPAFDGGLPISDYVVEYSIDGSTGWTPVPHSASTTLARTITGLTPGGTYYVRVAAQNEIGDSTHANATPYPATASTRLPTAPDRPTSVVATAGVASGSVDVTWMTPASDGGSAITDYVVEYTRSLSGPWSAFAHAASTATTITLTGLVPGGAYFVRVSATNAVGTSPSALATPQPVVAKDGTLDPKEIGDLREGRSLYTEDGVPSPFTLEPNASTNPIALVAQTDDWRMRLAGYGDDTDPLGLTAKQALLLESQPNARARATASPVAKTSGVGFKPLSEVRLYILPSTYLGTLNTDAQGAFTGSVPIPRGIEPGVYTLQANGYAPSGAVRSLSIGVRVVSSGPTVQRPTKALNLPERLDAGKVTTLVKLPIRTNAGQRATVSATCSPLLRAGAPAGDLARACRIIRDGDRLRVWISGTMRVVVELRITAPAKDGFTKYARVKRWVAPPR